jgi:DNA invertase Pin-like site-specific DNA recombinase
VKAEDSLLFWEISSLLGEQGAFLLFREFAGRRVYVPLNIKSSHRFAVLLGVENAAKLSQRYPGERLEFPCGWVRRKLDRQLIGYIRRMRKKGFTVAEISKRLNVSRRTVFNQCTLISERWSCENFEQLNLFECIV